MPIHLTFLGTSCSTPTKERNLSSLALSFRGKWFLFDTPEGVQQQLMRGHLSYLKLDHVFISHFHGDHILGLPGLLATMNILERKNPLHVWGPKGMEVKVKQALHLGHLFPQFEIIAHEAKDGILIDEKEFFISAVKLNHSALCYGYIFEAKGKKGEFQRAWALKHKIPEGPLWRQLQEGKKVHVDGKIFKPEQVMDYSKGKKGAKTGLIFDTFPQAHYIAALKGCDVIVHESTFLEEEKERARETLHSTAKMAAEIARKVKAKQLFLTHFSPRYADTKELLREAKEVFPHTIAAHDLLQVELEESYSLAEKMKTRKKKKE